MVQRVLSYSGGLLLAALILVGCVAPMPGMMVADSTAVPKPEPVPGQLTVVDAKARPAPLAGGNGAVYLTVLNGLAEDVQLVSAASPAAGVVELHETVNDGGVMRMVHHPEGFPVPAGGDMAMVPGGKHVMLIGVAQALSPGDSVELLLSFDNGETISLSAPVVDMAGAMQGQMPADMHGQASDEGGASHGSSMEGEGE